MSDYTNLIQATIEELRAVKLYTSYAEQSEDPTVKAVFLDVAHEERVHAGEFLSLLMKIDPSIEDDLIKGKWEVVQNESKRTDKNIDTPSSD